MFHVTGVEDHTRQENEPSYSQALRTERVTGVVDGKRYHLSEPMLMAYRFKVGKDYPVLKLKPGDNRIDLQVTDKKGRERKETLTILAVEEVN